MKDLSLRLVSALALLLLLDGPAFAGAVYSFVTETRDGFNDGMTKGRLIVDGEKFRMEHEPTDDPMLSPVVISKDGGEHSFSLDPEARTFFGRSSRRRLCSRSRAGSACTNPSSAHRG